MHSARAKSSPSTPILDTGASISNRSVLTTHHTFQFSTSIQNQQLLFYPIQTSSSLMNLNTLDPFPGDVNAPNIQVWLKVGKCRWCEIKVRDVTVSTTVSNSDRCAPVFI